MHEKKVIAVIVEGPSDEVAIGGILKEFFSSEEVQFAVVHGDITSDFNTSLDDKSPDYVLKKVHVLIDGVRDKYGYKWEDFLRIIHIADTDGIFTKGCIQKANIEELRYFETHIEAPDVAAAQKRNDHKAKVMEKLYSTGKITKTIGKKETRIQYRLYFNSCNLEHVLYNSAKDVPHLQKCGTSFAELYYFAGASLAASGAGADSSGLMVPV